MVDWYGRWKYEPDTPEEKKCDADRIADYIVKQNYKPKTTIENLVAMIISHHWDEDDDVFEFVEASGGLQEFDYFC